MAHFTCAKNETRPICMHLRQCQTEHILQANQQLEFQDRPHCRHDLSDQADQQLHKCTPSHNSTSSQPDSYMTSISSCRCTIHKGTWSSQKEDSSTPEQTRLQGAGPRSGRSRFLSEMLPPQRQNPAAKAAISPTTSSKALAPMPYRSPAA